MVKIKFALKIIKISVGLKIHQLILLKKLIGVEQVRSKKLIKINFSQKFIKINFVYIIEKKRKKRKDNRNQFCKRKID